MGFLFSAKRMQTEIQDYSMFTPGKKIDLVFKHPNRTQKVRPSVIFECCHNSRTMVVSQTRPTLTPDESYALTGVTTLIEQELNEKDRVGVSCNLLNFMQNYRLTSGNRTKAMRVRYMTPLKKINIRESYRFHPSGDFSAQCKIKHTIKGLTLPKAIKVYNLSIHGIGVLIPVKSHYALQNVSLKGKVGPPLDIELCLMNPEANQAPPPLLLKSRMIWQKTSYNRKHVLWGLKFEPLDQQKEEVINQFVHHGQLYAIRKKNHLS